MFQIEGDRTVNLAQFQQWKTLLDRLGRVSPVEGVHNGIERYLCARDIVSAVPFFDVRASHQMLSNSVSHRQAHFNLQFLLCPIRSPRWQGPSRISLRKGALPRWRGTNVGCDSPIVIWPLTSC